MKSIWKGSIAFGLVNIPVKLYSATQDSALDLDMLDKKDHANIHFKRVNANTGKEVAWVDIVKGYKIENRYVVLSDKDIKSAGAAKSEVIEIEDFVDEEEIDSIYFETPYYLEPEKSGTRAYALLREALKKTHKVGVSTFVLRNREHLTIVRAHGDILMLNRLRFAEEIRDDKELNIPVGKNDKKGEMDMAVSLINQLSGKFNIAKYKDTYHEQLMKVIKAKARGAKIATPKMHVIHKSGDLMSQLKTSLNRKKKKAS